MRNIINFQSSLSSPVRSDRRNDLTSPAPYDDHSIPFEDESNILGDGVDDEEMEEDGEELFGDNMEK